MGLGASRLPHLGRRARRRATCDNHTPIKSLFKILTRRLDLPDSFSLNKYLTKIRNWESCARAAYIAGGAEEEDF